MLSSASFLCFRIRLNRDVIGSWGLFDHFLLVGVRFGWLTLETSSLRIRGAISFDWLILSMQSFCLAVSAHIVRGRNFVHHESLLLLLFELNWRCPHSVVKTKVIAGIALGLRAQGELGEGINRVSHLLPHSMIWLGSVGCNFLDSLFDELVAHRTLLICHGAH